MFGISLTLRSCHSLRLLQSVLLVPAMLLAGCGGMAEPEMTEEIRESVVREETAVVDDHLAEQMERRKIVYTARMQLEVETFDRAVASLHELVDEHRGFVASHEIDGSSGVRRSGHWTIRIPGDSFDEFHAGLKSLGIPLRDSIDSREVTEEYVDVERRIENLNRMAERLRQHLEQNTKSLNDIFEVEKELTRVGAETERLQGRLQLLQDLVMLATIHLDMNERAVYETPATPTFAVQIRHTFSDSSGALISVMQGGALLAVGLAPWMPLLLVAGFAVRFVVKRTRRMSQHTV